MPTRLIDSTPPPIVMSCWPLITWAAAKLTEFETGRAEAVDLHARHRVAKARGERAHARDVAARFADRIDAAHHDVVDLERVEMVAILDRLQRRRSQVKRRGGMQRAVRLAAPARRSHVIVDECVNHSLFSMAGRAALGVQGSRSGRWRCAA